MREIFWLHIKKSGGQSARKALHPHYVVVDKARRPKTFIQSGRSEWNDVLNNYRVPLGEYQFRRCLFARTYLYKDDFAGMFKFAFVRDPVDRCLSQFFYLWRSSDPRKADFWYRRALLLKASARVPPRLPRIGYDFDLFLDAIEACRESKSHFHPQSLHFQTHTAPMWDDVVDEGGEILLDRIWRLEDFGDAIAHVHRLMGTERPDGARRYLENATKRPSFGPSAAQRRRVEALFARDFDLYETRSG